VSESVTGGGFVPYPGLDCAPAREWQQVQSRLLQEHLAYAAAHSPYYRRLFGGAAPEAGGLAVLPLTAKSDLERDGLAFVAVPEGELADLCLTSGTTGKPVAMMQSRRDLERLAYNEEQSFRLAGVTGEDRVLLAAAVDRCFMAGLAYLLGLQRIGATVVRGGSSNLLMLCDLVKSVRLTAMVGVPSLLLAVGERLKAEGADPSRKGIGRLVCIGEPVRGQDLSLSPLGERLQELWGAQVFGTYASTEMATAFTDCPAGLGGHLRPELMVVEILDEQGAVVPPGIPGEVVATPLQVTGMPLVRFRTGDIAALHDGPCPCGRTTPRLGPVLGRKSQMLKVRGTTVYPPAIFTALQGVAGISGYYLEARSDYDLSDTITVVVGTREKELTPAVVAERIAAAVRVKPEVVLVSPEEAAAATFRQDKRKPVIFFDYRQPAAQPQAEFIQKESLCKNVRS
jgi:phenylacetate-CoA ligase